MMEVSEILCIVMELGPKNQQVNGVATAVVASCDIYAIWAVMVAMCSSCAR